MSEMIDEFDSKAREFLDDGRTGRIKDILREYAMTVAYEMGEELENPSRFLQKTGIDPESIDDFTEFRVAKSVIRKEVREDKNKSYFSMLKGKVGR